MSLYLWVHSPKQFDTYQIRVHLLFQILVSRSSRVADQHHFNADPDLAVHFNADPYPHQGDANLLPLVYRSSRAPF